LLHQASRQKDEAGRIVAEIEDYEVVRELVADLMAIGIEAAIKPEVREVVEAVKRLLREDREEVSQSALKPDLNLDASVISRRVAEAIRSGLLKNLEDRKGRSARLVRGDPLPDDVGVLPSPEVLLEATLSHDCTLVPGDSQPLPPAHRHQH
jgi:hypothetical protein